MNPMDLKDTRPISELLFGIDAAPDERPAVVEEVRRLLTAYNCTVADDIATLGCTGVMHKTASSADAIRDGKFLRGGVAGGGVGLPCFVPIDRYCLIHETFGGLEPGQAQHYPDEVEKISRELTPPERARVALIERARRVDEGSLAKTARRATDVLTAQDKETQNMLREEFGEGADVPLPVSVRSQSIETPWKCPTHAARVWACRYCMAQAIVEGPLEPSFVAHVEDDLRTAVDPTAMVDLIQEANANSAEKVYVYVLAAALRRTLA